ncbi:aspartate 1-decarboxylase [Clostridium pasteurianum DSM 525 = ATCC 6013]|uniref:Aspartate 1-decarboxylase n=1 Tax=Clostridium pasteurianum DSM 525 = ATCC 6013 TaxID=1262449 RepID=A0A0H3J7W5_CLOPA|nr:aspartate 1-decarboxylase [Clostridium pasteurianum]AJA49292.1 aspartate 1-decarboxylase [Clostridium pasteurianum DSM 525 = ATCC 6013]AJA53280.1 aspartate 1-decarboxylase [Clostridium pasteurianum DSM 525 = ATCC 6013]AOZ76470.1 aspartate decarboxylase [Clostridium pasteurianum DSM 525 = ATCC 6013]AOZ80267.1 aspartate decarboxylase [Clostridium pasteurianum]ELP58312.1 aspartate alpha-decarboxylase [Clostridium pasteurianum DSM 525 = ATCC 6013]
MKLSMLKSKIHRATITEAKLNYVGSITIDIDLMKEANILEYEKIQVVNINNGSRIETYVIAGESGSGVICLNGAAARYAQPGDKVILMTYCEMEEEEAKLHKPVVVFVKDDNSISEITTYERHGEIK